MAVIGSDVRRFAVLDSTNSEAMRRARQGAPEGLVIIADGQTQGRGRQGRAFESLPGRGLYFSVLLRPTVPAAALTTLTGRIAVAACRAVEDVCPVRAGIRWMNDLVLNGKKIGGILTEGFPDELGGQVIIAGIGINLTQTAEDFSPELRKRAASLAMLIGSVPGRDTLADAIMARLDEMYRSFPDGHAGDLAEYRARCVTVGQMVLIPASGRHALAVAVEDDFALTVRYEDACTQSLRTGEAIVPN